MACRTVVFLVVVFLVIGFILVLLKWERHPREAEAQARPSLSVEEPRNGEETPGVPAVVTAFLKRLGTAAGPTDEQAESLGRFLVSQKCTKAMARQWLGEPGGISQWRETHEGSPGGVCWGYSIADSRAITLWFSEKGELVYVRGVGAGFDTIRLGQDGEIEVLEE